MSRPEEAGDPAQDTTTDWYRSFEVELASRGLPSSEVERTAASTRAEVEAAVRSTSEDGRPREASSAVKLRYHSAVVFCAGSLASAGWLMRRPPCVPCGPR